MSKVREAVDFYIANPDVEVKEISKMFGLGKNTIRAYIRRNNLNAPARQPKKFGVNEEYFDVIDTERKAYWLGFMSSDGSYSEKGLRVSQCGDSGLKLLSEFKRDISFEGNITSKEPRKDEKMNINSKKTIYEIKVTSKNIHNKLLEYGIKKDKAKTIRMPNISDNLKKHFIRGFFDGDGSVSIYENKYGLQCEFSITSNENMLLDIQEVLISELGLNKTKLKEYDRGRESKSLRYFGKKNSEKIFQYLYGEATVFIDYKFNLLKQYGRTSTCA